MLIGNNYATNKIYRGIKHYDGLPLLSEDIHESMDTLSMKAAYFTENLVGSGTLNTPECEIATEGVYLKEPSAILVKGDIALIQSDIVPIASLEYLSNTRIVDGLVCIVGWYQHIDTNSTIHAYGGLNNSTLKNDLLDDELGMQVSSRYQFVWDIALVDKSEYESGEERYHTLSLRDSKGVLTGESVSLYFSASKENIREAETPSIMNYAVSNIYMIPIISYKYNISNNTIESANAVSPISIANNIANLPVVESKVHTVTIAEDQSEIIIDPEFIEDIQEDNLVEVLYNGVPLSENYHYRVDYKNSTVILLDFSTEVFDEITFIKKATKGRAYGGSGVSTFYDETTGNLIVSSIYDENTGNLTIR